MESLKGKYFDWVLKDKNNRFLSSEKIRELNIDSLIDNIGITNHEDVFLYTQITRVGKDMFDKDWLQNFIYNNGYLYMECPGYKLKISFEKAEEIVYNISKNSDIFNENSVINLMNYKLSL